MDAAIDAALSETAAFVAESPRARSAAYVSAVTGQKIFDDATQSLVAINTARARIAAAHNRLAALARKMGLDLPALGPLDKPEATPPIGGGPRTALLEA